MSIYTTTVSHLMQLDKDALTYALRIFQKELDGVLDLLNEKPEARQDEELLNDLSQALTMRKAVAGRLEELVGEEPVQPKLSYGSTASDIAA